MRKRLPSLLVLCSLLVVLASPSLAQGTPPAFSKAFAPDIIGVGNVSTLTFLITNVDLVHPVTDLAFTDVLPAGVTIAAPAAATTDCEGTLTAPAGGTTIALSGGRVGTGSACTVRVNVTSSAAGAHVNISGDLTSSAGNSGSATDTLTVDATRLRFSKSFARTSMPFNETTTLTFLIDNTGNAGAVSFLDLSDNLPAGLLVASPARATTTCTGGLITAVPGTGVIHYGTDPFISAASVPGNSSCTVSVDVTAGAVGTFANTTENLTSGDSPLLSHGKATASLEVPFFQLHLSKSFVDDPAPPGSTVTLEFAIANNSRDEAATAISFSDDLTAVLSGLAAVGLQAADVCGAGSLLSGTTVLSLTGGSLAPGASCTFAVTVQVPGGAAWGVCTNTTTAVTGDVGGTGVVGNVATDSLIVEPVPSFAKSFLDDPAAAGDTVDLEFTITNVSPSATATGIAFTDDLAAFLPGAFAVGLPANDVCGAGSQLVGTTSLSFSGGTLSPGASCTFAVTLQLPASVVQGAHLNTTSELAATVGGVPIIAPPATDSLSVIGTPVLTKSFTDDPVAPGDSVTLEFTLDHSEGVADATGIAFTDDLGAVLPGLTAVGLPADDVCGAGSQLSGTTQLSLTGASLAPMASCTFAVTLQVPDTAPAGDYANTTSGVTANVLGLQATGDPAADTLTVSGLTLAKTFLIDLVDPGDIVALQFVLSNTSPISIATGIAFTDDLSAVLPGLVAVGLPDSDVCGAGSQVTGTGVLSFTGGSLAPGTSCTLVVALQVPDTTADGEYRNTTSEVAAEVGGTPIVAPAASDDLTILAQTHFYFPVFLKEAAFPPGLGVQDLPESDAGESSP